MVLYYVDAQKLYQHRIERTQKCRNSTDKSTLDTDYLSDDPKTDGVLAMATYQKRMGKDGTVSYRALVRITGFPPQSATFKSKTKAAEWAMRTEIALRDGKYLPQMESKRRTVGELIDRYLNEELPKKQNKSRDIRVQLGIWRDLIGQYSLTAIKTDILKQPLLQQDFYLLAYKTAAEQFYLYRIY